MTNVLDFVLQVHHRSVLMGSACVIRAWQHSWKQAQLQEQLQVLLQRAQDFKLELVNLLKSSSKILL